ncbi:hypothetical protein AFLA_013933 [Aspergillus flavus NRRL3357]|nr:hypothetical protein AFLA_013933 [Aspergillus flavus NRRL3357]
MSPHDDQLHRNKRRKVDSAQGNDAFTDITSHGQLRNLLTFQQNINEVKQGIKKFKDFLLATGQTENEGEKAKKFRILKAYCDSQISHEEEPSCFPDLIQTWNFADSNNNESLLTVVPSVLALFIKTVSTNLDFRDFGLALCKFLLKKEQLRFFNRGLTATKSKEHLISPCLRLLTEIVSFDGGAVARHVYAVRYITFKRIEVFLTPNKSQLEEASDDIQKSTLRRNAQRYVLANLRFQHASAKSDIIEQHKVIRAFLEYVRKDPRDTVLDIIKAIERDIVQDTSLSRNAKTKFFNRGNLEKLVTLYGYDRDSEEPNPTGVSIASEIHKILMNVCTNSSNGVLLSETSWYPNGSDPESLPGEEDTSIDLGLDSAVYVDKYRESVPVRNGILSYLAQTLRPDADSLQIELLVAIFKEAPELVADFFTKKTMFVSDPKPTSSWMAESALLFSTVSLPVPTNFGWKDKLPSMPPPVSVVIENILPRPLTQKTLTRCLNLNAEIITLFAVRILTISFNKLRKVLRIFNSDHGVSQSFWTQAKGKLIAEFCRRCPAMKDVVSLYKKTAKEDLQQQEAVAELLSCFYEIVPDVAFEEIFDVSLVLVDILKRLDESSPSEEDSESLLAQLGSILKIAQQSASMRWWQQPGSMQFSAFTSILKLYPIVAAITEQWPFVVKSGGDAESAVGAWIAKTLGKLKGSGEDPKALKAARDTLVAATENKRTKSTLKKALKDTEEETSQDSNRRESSTTQPTTLRSSNEKSTVDLEEIFGTLPTEGTTHNALHRWEKEDIEISVEQGRVADLMLCLCSEHEEVRRQAFANITRFMSKIRESKYVEWRSVFLLTGELLETVKQIGLESPVPWIVGECASNCLAVLVNPMHKLYGKVNKFLQKAPSWEPEKIPSYWIDKILLHEPELDDGYFEETNWLLDLLIKGLRTETDMGIYRRANVFERALSFYESPGPSLPSKRKILHLLYRSTQVQGSTTLITRAGIVSWIQSQIPALGGKEVPTFTAMAFSLYESSEQDRVMKWSGGSVAQAVENIAV